MRAIASDNGVNFLCKNKPESGLISTRMRDEREYNNINESTTIVIKSYWLQWHIGCQLFFARAHPNNQTNKYMNSSAPNRDANSASKLPECQYQPFQYCGRVNLFSLVLRRKQSRCMLTTGRNHKFRNKTTTTLPARRCVRGFIANKYNWEFVICCSHRILTQIFMSKSNGLDVALHSCEIVFIDVDSDFVSHTMPQSSLYERIATHKHSTWDSMRALSFGDINKGAASHMRRLQKITLVNNKVP